jgi:hypothetical protein
MELRQVRHQMRVVLIPAAYFPTHKTLKKHLCKALSYRKYQQLLKCNTSHWTKSVLSFLHRHLIAQIVIGCTPRYYVYPR